MRRVDFRLIVVARPGPWERRLQVSMDFGDRILRQPSKLYRSRQRFCRIAGIRFGARRGRDEHDLQITRHGPNLFQRFQDTEVDPDARQLAGFSPP
jgi:hypothetical protein